jgi:hypothetical protein
MQRSSDSVRLLLPLPVRPTGRHQPPRAPTHDTGDAPTPTRSPLLMWNEISCSTRGPSAEYRADSFSTRSSPLAGQYAGGTPPSVGRGSCSISVYSWMRSRLRREAAQDAPGGRVRGRDAPVAGDLELVEHADPPEDHAAERDGHRDREAGVRRVLHVLSVHEVLSRSHELRAHTSEGHLPQRDWPRTGLRARRCGCRSTGSDCSTVPSQSALPPNPHTGQRTERAVRVYRLIRSIDSRLNASVAPYARMLTARRASQHAPRPRPPGRTHPCRRSPRQSARAPARARRSCAA